MSTDASGRMRCACARVARAAAKSPARYCRRASSDSSAPVTALLATSRSASHLRRPVGAAFGQHHDRLRVTARGNSRRPAARPAARAPRASGPASPADPCADPPATRPRAPACVPRSSQRTACAQVALRARDPRGGQRSPHVGAARARAPARRLRCALPNSPRSMSSWQRNTCEMKSSGSRLGGGGIVAQRRRRIGAPVVEIAEEALARGIVRIGRDRPLQQRQGFVQPELLGAAASP